MDPAEQPLKNPEEVKTVEACETAVEALIDIELQTAKALAIVLDALFPLPGSEETERK